MPKYRLIEVLAGRTMPSWFVPGEVVEAMVHTRENGSSNPHNNFYGQPCLWYKNSAFCQIKYEEVKPHKTIIIQSKLC